MNNFKRYTNSPSPYSKIQKNTDLMTKNKMTLEEAVKSKLGSINITASIEEDTETMQLLGVPMVAFLCKISIAGRTIAIGRGSSIFSQNWRVIERVCSSAYVAALTDALVRGTRSIESMNISTKIPNSKPPELKARYEEVEAEPATEKQLNYLRMLINTRIADEDERDAKLGALEGISKDDCSDMIQSFQD